MIYNILSSIGFLNIFLFTTIFLLGIYLKTNKGKGKLGELILSIMIYYSLDKNKYKTINNVTLKLSENDTTQIDLIIISIYGIFVIETKNFQGTIYGKKDDKQWTQSFGSGKRRNNKFQNPLFQNYKHIQSLIELINLDKNKVFSLIAFAGNCTLKIEDTDNVVYFSKIINLIKNKKQILFSNEEVNLIFEKIIKMQMKKNSETDKKHIQNLENRFKKNDDIIIHSEVNSANKESFYNLMIKKEETIKQLGPSVNEVEEATINKKLLKALLDLRNNIAKKENIKAFQIFSNKTIDELVLIQPKTKDDMLKIFGIGEMKFEKYGEIFLEEIINNKYKK